MVHTQLTILSLRKRFGVDALLQSTRKADLYLYLSMVLVILLLSSFGCASVSTLKSGKLSKRDADSMESRSEVTRTLERNGKRGEAIEVGDVTAELIDQRDDIDDIDRQISEIEKEIRIRQENLEKRLESTRRQESAELVATAKRKELARLKEIERRLELAEREELATRLKLAEHENTFKQLALTERKNPTNIDKSANLDPMSKIAKLIEENKRIKKRTNQPAR